MPNYAKYMQKNTQICRIIQQIGKNIQNICKNMHKYTKYAKRV